MDPMRYIRTSTLLAISGLIKTPALAGLPQIGWIWNMLDEAAQAEAERMRLINVLAVRSPASVIDLYNHLRDVPTDEIRAVADAIQANEDRAYERVRALLDGRPFEPPASEYATVRCRQNFAAASLKTGQPDPSRRPTFAARARKLSRW